MKPETQQPEPRHVIPISEGKPRPRHLAAAVYDPPPQPPRRKPFPYRMPFGGEVR